MKLPITIEYNSGDQATYVAGPPEWAKWEVKFGRFMTKVKEEGMGLNDFLFLAYQSMKREASGKPIKSYEIWVDTIADVIVGDDDPKAIQSDQ